MRRFTATMDSLAKTLTFVLIVVLVIPFITIITQYLRIHDLRLLIGPVVITAGIIFAFLHRPKEYHLDAGGLRVIRIAGPVHVRLQNIRSIIPVSAKSLGPGIRTLLYSGGLLGYFGRFYYREHGYITLYATDRSRMLLITLDDERKIIISPDDTEGFMAAFSDIMRK